MGRERRATSAIKTLKYNYQLKEGVRGSKVTNKKKKNQDFLFPCYFQSFFFSLRGAQARSHTSSNTGYFETPQRASGSGSPRMNQNVGISLMNTSVSPEMLEK